MHQVILHVTGQDISNHMRKYALLACGASQVWVTREQCIMVSQNRTLAWPQFHTARKAVEGIKDDRTRLMELGQVQWASGDREGALRHCAFLLRKIGDDEAAAPFALHAQAMVLYGGWLAQLRTENPKVIIQNVCAHYLSVAYIYLGRPC